MIFLTIFECWKSFGSPPTMVVPHEILVPTTGAFSTCSFIPPGVLTPGQPETAPPPLLRRDFHPCCYLLLTLATSGKLLSLSGYPVFLSEIVQ
jgi:hypothetical protein